MPPSTPPPPTSQIKPWPFIGLASYQSLAENMVGGVSSRHFGKGRGKMGYRICSNVGALKIIPV